MKFPLLAVPLFAAAAAATPPEEIVVSGYRPLTTQELDTSISLLDDVTLARATLANFEQVVQLVPNMNLSGEGSRARYFQLRGVGEREQYEGAPNPSVGFIVDDIDLSGIGGVAATYDVRQIEVLRGPQSARYGSSALAGMVYVQTANPGDEFALQAEVGAGNADTTITGGAVGGAITDSLSGRFTVYRYTDNGFRRNLYLGRDDTNERDELTWRGKLNWELGAWNALLTGFVADYDNGYDAWSLDPIDNPEVVLSDEPGRDAQKTRAGSLRVSGPLVAGAELVSITTVAATDVLFSFDSDWAFDTAYLPVVYDYRYRNPRERDTVSQELRLVSDERGRIFSGTTDWVVGLYAQQLDETNNIDSTGDYVDTSVGCDPGFCIADRQISSAFESTTLALFGGLDSRLSERVTLSLGLRVERWDADYSDVWVDNGIFIGNPGTVTNRFDPTDTLVGGHFALSFDISADVRSYLRIAKGFKAGGFNPSLSALASERIEYGPEALWNFEVGVKGAALAGALNFDLAFFSQQRDDAQLSQSDQFEPSDPNTFVFVTGNGAADSYGLEAAVDWQVADWLQLHGSLGLLESRIDTWAVRPAVEGRALAHAPAYTLNAGATFSGPFATYARIDINAVGTFYYDISHDEKSDDYRLVNLRIGKDWEHWSVALWGRNIFDTDKYRTRGFLFGNVPPDFAPQLWTKLGDPRQVGVTLSYRY